MSPKLTKDFRDFIELLHKYAVDFAICGGHAVAFHGYPRMTFDFDILILPTLENACRIMQALKEFGFGGIPELNESVFESTGSVFSLGVQPNQIDLMTAMSSQDIHEVFRNKVTGQLDGLEVYFVSFDDLIRAKREANRLKDQLDVEELMKLNPEV